MAKKQNNPKPAPAVDTVPAEREASNFNTLFFNHAFLPVLVLAGVACVAWVSSLGNDFVYFDDDKAILYNRALQNPSLGKFFSGQNLGMYAPLTWIAYWIGKGLSGDQAWGYHAISVLLHAINAVLVFLSLQRLTSRNWAPFAAALLFAVHPMQAEAVCWAAAQSAVLFSTFYLLAFWAWINWSKSGRAPWYALAFLSFILACLSKSAAVTLPLLLVAADLYLQKSWKNTAFWMQKAPFFALSLYFGFYTFSTRAQEGHDIAASSSVFSAADRFFMVCQTLLFYPVKLLMPLGYSVAYPFVKTDGHWDWTYFIAPLVLAALGFAVWKFWRRKPEYLLGLALYLLPLSVMLPFRTVGSFELRSDRYVYLSCVGLFFLGALLLEKQKPQLRAVVLGVAALILIPLANWQTQVWKNGVNLFENCVNKTPESALCQCNLAYNELITNNFEKSAKHYSEALKYDPNTVEAYNGRGQAYLNLRKVPEALSDFDNAIKAGIVTPKLFMNRGKCLVMSQRFEEAIPDLSKSLELEPKSHEAYFFRALARDKTGDQAAALEDYGSAIALKTDNIEALINRAQIYFNAKQYAEAIADQTKALSFAADQVKPLILNNRATANLFAGNVQAAMDDANQALSINPNYTRARQTRASIWQKMGNLEKMQEDLRSVESAGRK